MIFLASSVVCLTGLTQIMKLSMRRGAGRVTTGFVNYAAACAVGWVVKLCVEGPSVDAAAFAWGAAGGVCFVVGLYIMFAALDLAGVALTATFQQMSVLLTTGASILVWGETPDAWQVLGAAGVIGALVLVAGKSKERPPGKALAALLGMLALQGVSSLVPKAYVHAQGGGEYWTYVVGLYSTATLANGLVLLARRRFDPRSIAYGVPVGLLNLGYAASFVLMVARLPGVVAYPALAASYIVLNSALGRFVWKEELGAKKWAAVALAAVSVVLLNLGRK